MSAIGPEAYAQLLDSLPHMIMRLVYREPNWGVQYVNKAVERYGYKRENFTRDNMTWNDLLHPDDRVMMLKLSHDYMKNKVDDFKLQYRIVTKGGASIYITEYSHVNRNRDGSVDSIDSFLFENLEAGGSYASGSDVAARRNLALNDILLTIQDANTDPEKAIQFILDRTGALIDCSRALLFRDSPDHKTCKVVYEWLNHDITSIKDLDYAVTYATEMPEIYIALQDTGVLIVNAGEIPENCKEEFEAEGLVSSAIFAVYQYGDHYGFVCFDDCVVERRWDTDTVNFLKVVANLLSNCVMHMQINRQMEDYENTIKSLAFRDYLTRLPNHYPYDSDMADIILAAGKAGQPGYAVMIALNGTDAIRNAHGFMVATEVFKAIAERLGQLVAETLGERATLYRIAGTVLNVLVQPGDAEAVRRFAEQASECGRRPWRVEAGEFACALNVAAIPFGLKTTAPESIARRLDAATVESSSRPDNPLVFKTAEE